MATFELDVYDLSSSALEVVRAAVKFARLNSSVVVHVLPLKHFYHLAGLAPEISLTQFSGLLREVRHTSIFSSDFEPAVLRGWSIFEHLSVNETHLSFSVCSHAFDAAEPAEFLPSSVDDLEERQSSTR